MKGYDFHQILQEPGESAESFMRALYALEENCDLDTKKHENIRDSHWAYRQKSLTAATVKGRFKSAYSCSDSKID